MNCVSSDNSFKYFAYLITFASSSAASTSSNITKGADLTFKIEVVVLYSQCHDDRINGHFVFEILFRMRLAVHLVHCHLFRWQV